MPQIGILDHLLAYAQCTKQIYYCHWVVPQIGILDHLLAYAQCTKSFGVGQVDKLAVLFRL